MKNINNLIQNSNFSLEMQTRLYGRIADISDEIEVLNKHYDECKKLFLEADAILNKAIAEDDEAKMDAAQAIIQIVNELHEARDNIIQLTNKKKSFYKMLMNHQKKDEHISDLPRQKSEEHIYVLPRQKVVEFLKALDERVKANPDVESLELAIDTRFLKK
jgi:hypothetical protein